MTTVTNENLCRIPRTRDGILLLALRLTLFLVISVISGCTTLSVEYRHTNAVEIATAASFRAISLNTAQFDLAGFYKVTAPLNAPATLYIEGDGYAWVNRYTPSSNPTPKNPLGLKFATLDDSKNVLYLARPCQYRTITPQTNCSQKYWTSHRFAKEVVASYHQALDELKQRFDFMGFHLVGFSGGGTVATLLAADRRDVHSLRTVAGNLDHIALGKAHRVSILHGSLNPIDIAPTLRTLPQIHYSGRDDHVVPPWVATHFAQAVGEGKCLKTRVIRKATHLSGWLPVWERLSAIIPRCDSAEF